VKQCMDGDMPEMGISIMGGDCSFCTYARQRTELTLAAFKDQDRPRKQLKLI
jgi:hypothetical protein